MIILGNVVLWAGLVIFMTVKQFGVTVIRLRSDSRFLRGILSDKFLFLE